MSTVSAHPVDLPLTADGPAQRLRRTAAAVRVRFTWWGTHKALAPGQKADVGLACAADARLLTAGKRLVDLRHPALRRLTSVKGRASACWRGLTLPYVEPGVRLLRQSDVPRFQHLMEGFRDELHEAAAHLAQVFAEIQADAQQRLGRLYNPQDYPEDVRGLFDLSWDFPSVEPPAYLLRVSPELYAEERARVAARFEEAVHLAEQAFVRELTALVDHLRDRLQPGPDGTAKVFRGAVLRNFREFLERFATLSIDSHPELDALVEQARGLLEGVTPEGVRTTTEVRDQLHAGMSAVREQLDGLVANAPRRRIIRPTALSSGGTDGVTG
jgi:hypothetical protein